MDNTFGFKIGDKVKVHIYDSTKREINLKEVNDIEFEVYVKNGQLGIDYDKYGIGWFRHEDGFRPLNEFSTTHVKFEKVN